MTARNLIDRALAEGRSALNEAEAKELLREYGVPVVDEFVCRSADDAVSAAEHFGFPVVVKGLGATLTHKTDLGLVRLNLRSPGEVRAAADTVAEATCNPCGHGGNALWTSITCGSLRRLQNASTSPGRREAPHYTASSEQTHRGPRKRGRRRAVLAGLAACQSQRRRPSGSLWRGRRVSPSAWRSPITETSSPASTRARRTSSTSYRRPSRFCAPPIPERRRRGPHSSSPCPWR